MADLNKIKAALGNEGGLVPFSEHGNPNRPVVQGGRCWGIDLARNEAYITPFRKRGESKVSLDDISQEEADAIHAALMWYLTAEY